MGYALSNYAEEMLLNGLFRTAAFVKPSQIVVELLKTLPSDDNGTGLAALTMTGYAAEDLGAPVNGDWSDPSAGTQGEVDNVAEIDFGTLTGTAERVVGVAIYNETAKTNLLLWGALANNWRGFSVHEADEVFTSHAHGLSVDDRVFLRGLNGATGVVQQTEYYVGTVPSVDTFTLSTTAANANPVAITADGFGEIGDSKAKDINDGDAVKFAAGALNISLN